MGTNSQRFSSACVCACVSVCLCACVAGVYSVRTGRDHLTACWDYRRTTALGGVAVHPDSRVTSQYLALTGGLRAADSGSGLDLVRMGDGCGWCFTMYRPDNPPKGNLAALSYRFDTAPARARSMRD